MKRTGEILRKEREARGLSLHEIGLSLKINSKILKAIEEGDTTQLPAKTFLRGFVQSYAAYLKLNVEEVLRVFAEEMGSTRPQPVINKEEVVSTPPSPEKKSDENIPIDPVNKPQVLKTAAPKPPAPKSTTTLEESSTTKALIFAVVAVVLAGLITLTVKVIDKYQREAQIAAVDVKPIEQLPPANEPAQEKVAEKEKAGEKKVEPTPAPVPAPTPAPAVALAPTPPPAAAPKPEEKKVAEVKPAPAPAPVVAAKPAPAPAPTPAPAVTPPPAAPGKSIELIIEALDRVEIEYAAGAGKKDKTTLSEGQIHTFKSNAGLQLNISNGGAVNVILNGRDIGVPGASGKPVKLSY